MPAATAARHTRTTSHYTLTLTVNDPATTHLVLAAVLSGMGQDRAGTVGDQDTAGISWRSPSDAHAEHVAEILHGAVDARPEVTVTGTRLHTGFGMHTREVRS